MQIGLGLPITRPTGGFNPRVVFGDGSNGLLWDYSATTGLYSDNLGATPLTAPDTGVGLVADRSRVRSPVTAYGGAQASAAFRPKWGRAPVSRRNLLASSEDFSAAVWTKTGVTVTSDAAVAPDGTMTADLMTGGGNWFAQTATGAGAANQTVTGSIWVYPPSGVTSLTIRIDRAGIAQGNQTVKTVTPLVWQRITHTATLDANTAAPALRVDLTGGTTLTVWGAQLELGSTATAYQFVTSTYDMTEAGVPSYGYIRPDRTDDVLSTVLTLAQTGDVAVFGRTGSKIESGLIYGAGATFSLGPTTVTGMSSGVLAAVGDVVGVLAIGRALTTAEKASTLAYFQARGAGAWL